jgi:phosphate transport system permease protein
MSEAVASQAASPLPPLSPLQQKRELEARASHRAATVASVQRFLVRLAAGITAAVLAFIILYIAVMGIPHISLDLFVLPYTSLNLSVMPALINTLLMTVFSLAIAIPLGIGAAVYLVEYTGRGNRFVNVIRLMAETLTGIPSIVYGLFGLLFFVTALQWRISLISGALTLAIMTLPVILRTTEEALKAVPDSYREGSFSLGAGRLRTVFRVLLPAAMPGILAGIILSIGRIFGESAALLYTAGSVAEVPDSIFDGVRTLSVHMYVLASEGLHIDKAYATAVVLLVIVLIINILSAVAARRITKGEGHV